MAAKKSSALAIGIAAVKKKVKELKELAEPVLKLPKNLFEFVARRKARRKLHERLSKIKAQRIAATGAARGRIVPGGKIDLRNQREREADARRAKMAERLARLSAERDALKARRDFNRRLDVIRRQAEEVEARRQERQGRRDEATQAARGTQNVINNPLGRYLFLGEPKQTPASSCVFQHWYDVHNKVLYIQFKDRHRTPMGTYAYGVMARSCTPEFAMSLWRTTSPGSWVWDNLRIRGTKLGHQVDYMLSAPPPGGMLWQATPESIAEHEDALNEQSRREYVSDEPGGRVRRARSGEGGIFGFHIMERFERQRPDQNAGRGEPEMRAPASKKAQRNAQGKYIIPQVP